MRTGRPKMGQGRACTMEAKALLVHPSYQGVCGRHGMEDERSDPWRSRSVWNNNTYWGRVVK